MATRIESLTRPTIGETPTSRSKQRPIGLGLAAVGVMIALGTLIANIAATGAETETAAGQVFAWSFGATTLAFGTVKLGIAVILIGILVRLAMRIDAVTESLQRLRAPDRGGAVQYGAIKTPFGPGKQSADTPAPLPIHRMAKTMWPPMLVMGAMAVAAGFVVSLVWSSQAGAGESTTSAAAWTQGLQFLGEGLLLAGISFLLGTILASLRAGGGDVQKSLGIPVQTLRMPNTAKVFVILMMLGLMVSIAQFVLYVVVANGVTNPAVWFAWLGPMRELGLGLLLSGIVMALVTIGNVLGFQFSRINQIIVAGR